MIPKKYLIRRYKKYTFFFKYEPSHPDLLHIWVRHMKEPKHAIKTFLEGEHTWNEKYERFETTSSTNTIYWFWLSEKENKIMIISCFTT